MSHRDPVWSSPDISRSSGQGGSEICSSAGAGVTSSSSPSRRKKARTGGEGDSYDPYDFSDAEEEMPEGEAPGFCWLLRVLLPFALVGLCTWGAVMPWGPLGSLVWYHRAPQIKMNFFWKPSVAVNFFFFFFFPVLFQTAAEITALGGREFGIAHPILRPSAFALWELGHQAG